MRVKGARAGGGHQVSVRFGVRRMTELSSILLVRRSAALFRHFQRIRSRMRVLRNSQKLWRALIHICDGGECHQHAPSDDASESSTKVFRRDAYHALSERLSVS